MTIKILITLVGIFASTLSHADSKETLELKIVSNFNKDDEYTITDTHISVHSKKGIGTATIELTSGQWPESLQIRLHLQGLEGFTATSGENKLRLNQLKMQAYDKSGEPFNEKYLLNQAGYYQVNIPKSLIPDGETKLKIHWVNFYR